MPAGFRLRRFLVPIVLVPFSYLFGCSPASRLVEGGIIDPHPGPEWAAILSPQQIAILRQTFPNFQPELFAPGTDPTNPIAFTPFNFAPAQFFGAPVPQGMRPTPLGIPVETNGYDGPQQPVTLPAQGAFFDRQLNPHPFTLVVIPRSPLNILEQHMGLSLTPNAPVWNVNLQQGRVDLAQIDQEMLFIRDQLAQRLPQIANVDPRNCEIVIEPSIFYVVESALQSGWAGGLTVSLDNTHYRLHLSAFYMVFHSNGQFTITNWSDYLIDEGLNFYVMAIGRSDLAA